MVASVFWTYSLFSKPKLVARGKTDPPKTSCSRFIDKSCPCTTLPLFFFLGDVCLSRCHGSLHAHGEVLLFHLIVCRDHSTPPLFGSKHGMGSRGSRWSHADNLRCTGSRCKPALMFILARLIAGVQKAGLDVHDICLASGSAHVLGNEVSPADSYCSGTGKRIARIR